MKIFIYKINGDEIYNEELNKYFSKIDIKKKNQIKNYVESFDKNKCFIAHLIIYLYFNGNVDYKYGSNGKIFNSNSMEFFNISYSGNYVVVVFNNNDVGIDIEKINRIEKNELNWYASNNEKKIFRNKLEYTKLWCLKESYLKYLGIGITDNLKNIEFEKNDQNYICKNNKDLYINVFEVDKEYICAVITNDVESVDIEFLDIKKLKNLLI